jgi:acylphosphatase
MSTQLCVQATIHGRVQGVGFRSWTRKNAQKRGLTGWVKNTAEGTVEAMFCGEETAVEQMLKECARGPLAAKVTKLERKMPDSPPPEDFKQLAS